MDKETADKMTEEIKAVVMDYFEGTPEDREAIAAGARYQSRKWGVITMFVDSIEELGPDPDMEGLPWS